MLACCWSFLRWSRAAARASGSPMQPRRLDHQGREIEYCPPLPQSPQWLRPLEPASGRMVPVSLPRGVAWNGSTHQEVFHPCLCGWRRGQPPCVCQITSWRVWHRVRNIPGQPCVAAAVAAPAIPKLWNRRRSTGARGCTVVPHAPGHLAAYPYGTVLPSNRAAARDLQERDRCHARKLVGETELPYRLSWNLVSTCEALCVAPAAWDAYPDEVKNAIRECFLPRPLGKAPPFNLFA